MRIKTSQLFLFSLLLSLFLAIPRSVSADKIRKIPVLVNWQGFAEKPHSVDDPDKDPTFSAEALADAKGRLTRAIADANKVLKQCESLVSNSLRLLNIQHQNVENGNTSPMSMDGKEDDFDKDAKTAKKELAEKFKKQMGTGKQLKGQKIFMVQDFPGGNEDAETSGMGRVGEPVMWINVNSLLELEGKSVAGPVLVHELLHNAGLGESDHTSADGNVFNESIDLAKSGMAPNAVVDRGLTKSQCEKLDEYFKKHGISKPNEAQQVGFVPQDEGLEEKSHYALVTVPAPIDPTAADLGILEYSISEKNQFTGRISWDIDLADSPLNANLFLAVEQLDTFVEISLLGEGDGQVLTQATSTIGGESGFVQEILFTSADSSEVTSSFLDFEFEIPESAIETFAVDTFVFDATSNRELSFSAQLEPVDPAPTLQGLPITVMPGDTLNLSGERFLAQEEVSLFINAAEVGKALVDGNLNFTASIMVPDLNAGDYLIEAVDPSGAFAIGVLTVVPEPASFFSFALGIVLLFTRLIRRR